MLQRRIEEASLNAWPAPRQLLYDGWIVRFADGYTKRANSVTPLYPSMLDLETKIDSCERLYREHGLPAIFRLTSWSSPPGLDEALAARGFCRVDLTLVLHLDLTAGAPPLPAVRLIDGAPQEWLRTFTHLRGGRVEDAPRHAAILGALTTPALYASIAGADGEPAACGLAVLEGDMVGLFDVVTSPSQRRRGYGRALVSGMLHWAQGAGAHHAYLQVVRENAPARALYDGMGFHQAYHYWYRVPSPSPA